jgi:hypothetical protein
MRDLPPADALKEMYRNVSLQEEQVAKIEKELAIARQFEFPLAVNSGVRMTRIVTEQVASLHEIEELQADLDARAAEAQKLVPVLHGILTEKKAWQTRISEIIPPLKALIRDTSALIKLHAHNLVIDNGLFSTAALLGSDLLWAGDILNTPGCRRMKPYLDAEEQLRRMLHAQQVTEERRPRDRRSHTVLSRHRPTDVLRSYAGFDMPTVLARPRFTVGLPPLTDPASALTPTVHFEQTTRFQTFMRLAKLAECGSGIVIPANDIYQTRVGRWKALMPTTRCAIKELLDSTAEFHSGIFSDILAYGDPILRKDRSDAETMTDPRSIADVACGPEEKEAKHGKGAHKGSKP